MAHIPDGYILLARKIMENELWLTKPALWYKTWTYILMKVNHTPSKLYPKGTGLFLWKNVKDANPELTSDIWYNLIKWLKQAEMITARKTARGLFIDVLNYEPYQNKNNFKAEQKTEVKAERRRNGGGMEAELYHNELKELNNESKDKDHVLTNLTTEKQDKDKYNTEDFFNKVWSRYPRRLGRKEALRHYQATVKVEQDFLDINKALNNYLTTDNVVNKTKYVLHGSTWFNNWRDWVEYTRERTGNESCQEYKNEHPVILFPTITEEQRLENIKNIKAIIDKIG